MWRVLYITAFSSLLLGVASAPAQAAPTLDNPGFTNGLTGWSYDGLVTMGAGNYALVQNGISGQGVSVAQAAGDLGLSTTDLATYLASSGRIGPFPADPNFDPSTSTVSLIFQSLGGTYSNTDGFSIYLNLLYDTNVASVAGSLSYGFIDEVNHTFVGNGGTVDYSDYIAALNNFGGGPYPGTDGYDSGTFPSLFGGYSGAIGTSDPVTFFIALTTNKGDANPSAFAVSFAPEAVPEIDPGHAALPMALSLGSFLLLADRRRRAIS